MSIKIVVDSAAMVPDLTAVDLDIGVVPATLEVGDEVLTDNVDIHPAELYRRLAGGESATASAPTPDDFAAAFHRAAASGHEAALFIVTCSSHPDTFEAALAAAPAAPLPVHVFDGRKRATALVAVAVARAANRGADLEACRRRTIEVTDSVRHLMAMRSWRALRRSQRWRSPAYAVAGGAQFRPMARMRGGGLRLSGIAASDEGAANRLADAVLDGSGRLRVEIFHADRPVEADELARRIRAAGHRGEVFVGPLTPVVGVLTGPGVLGVSWWWA